MPETKHSQENIAYIRTHVDNLERMVRFQISADPQSQERIRKAFERPRMAEVYLALAEGPLTQEELIARLRVDQSTVSRLVKAMYEAGLVKKGPARGESRVTYAWTDLEEMLGVSRMAREHVAKAKRSGSSKSSTKGASVRPARKK